MLHELKIKTEYFEAVVRGLKTFEIRKNDRKFQVDDLIVLKEINHNLQYTKRSFQGVITYITNFKQQSGYVVFGFKPAALGKRIN